MKILSIDTSSKICAVAVLEIDLNKIENINILKEVSQNNGLTHSEMLMPIIKQALEEIDLKIKDIDLIVCDKGPGSFTGIRIGVATAKAFEDSLKIPIIGISSLEALAYNVKQEGLICSLIDARNDSAYWSVFEKKYGQYILKENFRVDEFETILEELSKYDTPITFVGDGAIAYKDSISEKIINCKFVENNDLSAISLAIAGIKHFKENESKGDKILPLYIRKSQAEREKENEFRRKQLINTENVN